jgi:hypothetical protein
MNRPRVIREQDSRLDEGSEGFSSSRLIVFITPSCLLSAVSGGSDSKWRYSDCMSTYVMNEMGAAESAGSRRGQQKSSETFVDEQQLPPLSRNLSSQREVKKRG